MKTPAALNLRSHHVWSPAELDQWHRLYALRAQLAGLAARQAAQRVADGASTAALRACLDRMYQMARLGDYAGFLEADMNFHRAVVDLSGTSTLPEMWRLLEDHSRPFVAWAQKALFHDLEIIAQSHEAQWSSIAAGRPREAERATHIDLDALWQMLAEQSAEPFDEPDPVERVCAYTVVNLHQSLVFATVAREVAHLSPSHLARLFRDRKGEPYSVYVQNLRLRRAASLLAETDLAVQDIADRIGYQDPSRFAGHFRRAFGHAPLDHRRQANSHKKAP